MTCEPIDINYLLLDLVILNLNAMKSHTEFREDLWFCTAPYVTL